MQTSDPLFSNKYIKGFALVPTYLMLALLIAKLPIYLWFFLMLGIFIVTDALYTFVFSLFESNKAKTFVYVAVILFQLAVIFLIFNIR
jgi:hypothetical protein